MKWTRMSTENSKNCLFFGIASKLAYISYSKLGILESSRDLILNQFTSPLLNFRVETDPYKDISINGKRYIISPQILLGILDSDKVLLRGESKTVFECEK